MSGISYYPRPPLQVCWRGCDFGKFASTAGEMLDNAYRELHTPGTRPEIQPASIVVSPHTSMAAASWSMGGIIHRQGWMFPT